MLQSKPAVVSCVINTVFTIPRKSIYPSLTCSYFDPFQLFHVTEQNKVVLDCEVGKEKGDTIFLSFFTNQKLKSVFRPL